MSTRVQPSSSSQQQGKTGVSKDSATVKGKCAYSACPYEDDDRELAAANIKNSDYKFHIDCLDKFSQEMRAEGKNQTQDRIAVLDAQHGKSKESEEEQQQQQQQQREREQQQLRTSSSKR